MRKLIFGLLMSASLLLTACTESTIQKVENSAAEGGGAAPANEAATAETSSGSESNATAAEGSEEAQAEDAGPEIFALGDTVQFDNLLLTLNGVRVSSGDDFIVPSNDKFIIVDMTIENSGEESESVSTLMQMSAADAEGYQYNIALYTDLKGSLDGEVGAGRKIRGEVAFDVSNSEYYEFLFEDPFTNGQAIWKFTAQ